MTWTDQTLRGWWDALWEREVAAERLALIRITTCVALLLDIAVQQLPFYAELFGAGGLAPNGYSDVALLKGWRWTGYLFTPSGAWLVCAFGVWIALLLGLALGFRTRLLAVAVWLVTLAMLQRHYYSKNFGDSVLRFTTFLLVFVPSHEALSWDAWRRQGRLRPTLQASWGVRLFQLQLCAMYTATAASKLIGPISSTWYQGTSLHYALNDLLLARIAYPLFAVPLWVTLPLSYVLLAWETLFVPLVVWVRTRRFVLGFGLAFHLLSFLILEVGWFGFYVLAWYCAWIPDRWFTRVFYPKVCWRLPGLRSASSTPLGGGG